MVASCDNTWTDAATGRSYKCQEPAIGTHLERDGEGRPFLIPLCQRHGWEALTGRLIRRCETTR